MKKIETPQFEWIVADAQSSEDVRFLREDLALDPEILAYAVDKNELAHLEYDKFDKEMLLIYNALRNEQDYQTSPVSYFSSGRRLVTIFGPETSYLLPLFEAALEKRQQMTLFEFVFETLFLVSRTYFPVLETLNRKRHDINLRLREKTSKESLLELSDLETGLIYLVAASKQNASLLEKFQGQALYKELTEGELEQLEDAQIEAHQLMEMTNLSAQIIEQLEGTYNNVLNNDLNDTMKVLTKLSILLTIPSIITGFFGMNVALPQVFTENKYAWIWVIVLSVALWYAIGLVLGAYLGQWSFTFPKWKNRKEKK